MSSNNDTCFVNIKGNRRWEGNIKYQSVSAGPLGETETKQNLLYPQVSTTLIMLTAVPGLEANLKVETPWQTDKSTLSYSKKNQFVKAATGHWEHMERCLCREPGNLCMRRHQTVASAV